MIFWKMLSCIMAAPRKRENGLVASARLLIRYQARCAAINLPRQEWISMPWIIGIDEAGYGPNLGPLVMTSVACRVPNELAEGDLWDVLKSAVRRHPSEDDGRLLIEDSKLVYSPARGLLDLETGVIAALSAWDAGEPMTLGRFLGWL